MEALSEMQFMKDAEVAKVLRLNKETLKRMRRRGEGPRYHRLSPALVLYSAKDVIEYIQRCAVGGSAVA